MIRKLKFWKNGWILQKSGRVNSRKTEISQKIIEWVLQGVPIRVQIIVIELMPRLISSERPRLTTLKNNANRIMLCQQNDRYVHDPNCTCLITYCIYIHTNYICIFDCIYTVFIFWRVGCIFYGSPDSCKALDKYNIKWIRWVRLRWNSQPHLLK